MRMHTDRILWVAVAVFAVTCWLRINAIYQRTELHADEIYSVMLAQHNDAYINLPATDTVLTGADIRHSLVAVHPFADDMAALYTDNYDVPHASLYYMTLRVCLTGFDHFNAADIARCGGWLNILWWAVTFWTFYAMVRMLWRHRCSVFLMAVALTVAFAMPASVKCTLLVREYQMAQMFITLTACVVAAICQRMLTYRHVNWRLWLLAMLFVAGDASTGYLNAWFVGGVMLAAAVIACRRRRWRDVAMCVGAPLGGLLLAWAMYYGYFHFLTRYTVHTERAFSSAVYIPQLVFGDILYRDTLGTMGLVIMTMALAVTLAGKNRRLLVKACYQPWLPAIAVVSMCLVMYTSVLQAQRYAYPYLTVAMLVVPLVFNAMPHSLRRKTAGAKTTVSECVENSPSPDVNYITCLFVSVYMLTTGLLDDVTMNYNWTGMQRQLSQGAILYKFNANELPQIAPVLSDTAHYHLTTSANFDSVVRANNCGIACDSIPIVARVPIPADTSRVKAPLTGPLKIYTPRKSSGR